MGYYQGRERSQMQTAKPEGKSCLEDLNADERLLQWALKKLYGGEDWINFAQNGVKW
jgi:hypothetical protein